MCVALDRNRSWRDRDTVFSRSVVHCCVHTHTHTHSYDFGRPTHLHHYNIYSTRGPTRRRHHIIFVAVRTRRRVFCSTRCCLYFVVQYFLTFLYVSRTSIVLLYSALLYFYERHGITTVAAETRRQFVEIGKRRERPAAGSGKTSGRRFGRTCE